jgi:bacteriocin biosynthesis cyclodehydratase domain-containing protein
MEILHLLTGLAEPATLGASHIYDLRTMELKREPVVPEPGCPVCGEMAHDAVAEAAGETCAG